MPTDKIVEALHASGHRSKIEGAHLIEMCNRCGKRVSIGNDNTPNPTCPQDGCELNARAPGYIIDVFYGSAWITQDGQVTDKWQERGIWPTPEAAAEMMERCLSPK